VFSRAEQLLRGCCVGGEDADFPLWGRRGAGSFARGDPTCGPDPHLHPAIVRHHAGALHLVRARRPRRNVRAVTTDNGSGPDETALDAVGLPAVPVSAGALIFDRVGRLLILKPTYKSGWTIPGGVMEADGETPWDACRREVAEECGLHIGAGHPARLACMDFRRPRPGKPGGIRYLFDCGALSDASLAGIVVQPEEIAEHRVADLRTALTMLRKPIRLRVRAATRGHPLCYLEDGRPVPGVGSAGRQHPGRCNESRSARL
jgi:8-oxo-dGTP diphosphatase